MRMLVYDRLSSLDSPWQRGLAWQTGRKKELGSGWMEHEWKKTGEILINIQAPICCTDKGIVHVSCLLCSCHCRALQLSDLPSRFMIHADDWCHFTYGQCFLFLLSEPVMVHNAVSSAKYWHMWHATEPLAISWSNSWKWFEIGREHYPQYRGWLHWDRIRLLFQSKNSQDFRLSAL